MRGEGGNSRSRGEGRWLRFELNTRVLLAVYADEVL